MHAKVLPKGSAKLLARLERTRSPELTGWTLAGGTGLALALGHRISEDFDFFRPDRPDLQLLRTVLADAGEFEIIQEMEHTLSVIMNGVKMSFFHVADPFLFPTQPYRFFQVADPRDIALMKLVAVSGRGSRKDFVDLFCILRGSPPLAEYFDLLPQKYGKGRANAYHILKSLVYFEDAEQEPLPRMLVPFNWKECKAFFIRTAHAIILSP